MIPLDIAHLFVASLVLRLGVIGATAALWRHQRLARRMAFIGSALASTMTGVLAISVLRSGTGVDGVLLLHQATGLSLGYAIDGLSAWFLLILSVLGVPVAAYSLGYVAHPPLDQRSVFMGIAFNVLVAAVEIVFAAGDVLTFLGAWELMTLATAALVATEYTSLSSRRAAYLYLAMSHLGTGCLIAGFMALASVTGTFSFATLFSSQLLTSEPLRHGLFAIFFIGFGVKAGCRPSSACCMPSCSTT